MMNDQYERRALLLHLGDVFATIHAVAKCRDQYASLADAIAADDALSGFPLLHQVAGNMPPAAFVIKASGVFLSWPQALLAEHLDRQALTHPVEQNLFEDNSAGWAAYSVALQNDVPWFGQAAVPATADSAQDEHGDESTPS
jgi:hypothetical protein